MSCFVILSEAKNLSIPRRFAFSVSVIAKPRKGLWQSVSFALPISCKSADLQGYLLCFLPF